jgi:flagellar basal body-associated protein FliL|tara:strand:- start:22 stop:195 length:174 start_codon:yes stop_codon:yes gene_type:complete
MDEQLNSTTQEVKKSKTGLWIVLVLILIAIGVGIYFWLSGGNVIGGDSTLQPPALPE